MDHLFSFCLSTVDDRTPQQLNTSEDESHSAWPIKKEMPELFWRTRKRMSKTLIMGTVGKCILYWINRSVKCALFFQFLFDFSSVYNQEQYTNALDSWDEWWIVSTNTTHPHLHYIARHAFEVGGLWCAVHQNFSGQILWVFPAS